MKLVNTHTLFPVVIFLFSGISTVTAQTWSLQQCIDTAQVNNRNLQLNRNNLTLSEEREKEAKSNLAPKLSANADYKYYVELPYQLMPLSTFNTNAPEGQFKEAQFGVPHNINANVQLSMPLYNPQVYGAIKNAQIASELQELNYQKSEEQVYFDISNLYYNAQILKHQIQFIDSNLVNAERLLKNMKLLNEQLLAKGTDVSKIKLQISQLSTQKEGVKSKYNQVLNGLKFAMGIALDRSFEVDAIIQLPIEIEKEPQPLVEWKIINTQNQLLNNELSIINRSRFTPSLNLIGVYGTMGYGYDKKPNDFLRFYPMGFAGVQMSYPLFNGMVTVRKINQKKLEIRNNEIQQEMVSDQTNMLIENAKLQRAVSIKTVQTAQEQIEMAQNIYDQMLLQQKQGVASITDVLLADNALREAQQAYLSAIIDLLKADLELKKTTGNLIEK
ncbi:MAG: TolC family protein [Fluviicola sp.]|nr:TolC family protein [Fluviicola sp.]